MLYYFGKGVTRGSNKEDPGKMGLGERAKKDLFPREGVLGPSRSGRPGGRRRLPSVSGAKF